MKNLVLVTSALNTKFGVFSEEQRRQQTLATVNSVRTHLPGASVFVCEMSGQTLTTNQIAFFEQNFDKLLNFSDDASVKELFESTDNWDVVKNVTEVMCFGRALKLLKNTGVIEQYQRIFKLSGRYTIDERFDLDFYQQYCNQSLIVLGSQKRSQFPVNVTGVEFQHMSRLWSWPSTLTDEIIEFYDNSLEYMYQRLSQGGYVDIEHCLYKFLDHNKIVEKDSLGVSGNIAPNGVSIKD